ncbi:MAG TPA: alcohol dehydrogenase catalytic domain-containing protein [Bryobacteraceae bacterium]|nr:alcohol dehydrogenase catalytic domain-containing protein [Bryobacteraceae bacterium]
MRAAGLDFAQKTLKAFELQEPRRQAPDEVLFRVHNVGVCGTDRELARFAFGFPPPGEMLLALGHEAIGQVVEAGPAVRGLKPGDWVVPAVRRSCSPPCASCARGRRDLCLTGKVLERGIFGLHGYMTEYAVDTAADLFRVPEAIADVAVLAEPLSVVEKAVDRALAIHPGEPRTGLALGAGPIGILAALLLRLRGLDAAVFSREPEDHPRVRLIRQSGLRYTRRAEPGSADIIIEATGSAEAAFASFKALAPLGVYCILGSPNATGEMPFIDLLVKNQAVFGSINAGPRDYEKAIEDLGRLEGSILHKMIHRVRFDDFETAIPNAGVAVKTVHVL